MTELPRIPPTGPVAGIKAIKPVRRSDKESRQQQRERPTRKHQDSPSLHDEDEIAKDDSEPGKGSSINLRV